VFLVKLLLRFTGALSTPRWPDFAVLVFVYFNTWMAQVARETKSWALEVHQRRSYFEFERARLTYCNLDVTVPGIDFQRTPEKVNGMALMTDMVNSSGASGMFADHIAQAGVHQYAYGAPPPRASEARAASGASAIENSSCACGARGRSRRQSPSSFSCAR
jgi:hypothetical protein